MDPCSPTGSNFKAKYKAASNSSAERKLNSSTSNLLPLSFLVITQYSEIGVALCAIYRHHIARFLEFIFQTVTSCCHLEPPTCEADIVGDQSSCLMPGQWVSCNQWVVWPMGPTNLACPGGNLTNAVWGKPPISSLSNVLLLWGDRRIGIWFPDITTHLHVYTSPLLEPIRTCTSTSKGI